MWLLKPVKSSSFRLRCEGKRSEKQSFYKRKPLKIGGVAENLNGNLILNNIFTSRTISQPHGNESTLDIIEYHLNPS